MNISRLLRPSTYFGSKKCVPKTSNGSKPEFPDLQMISFETYKVCNRGSTAAVQLGRRSSEASARAGPPLGSAYLDVSRVPKFRPTARLAHHTQRSRATHPARIQ